MIFRNARLIFPDGIREGLEIVTQQGKIEEIRQQTKAPKNDIVDLDGNYLAPGFIDLHEHGAIRRDTMEASV
jgi:N-acetylglucosamine-6-phosphate deacetylase